MGIAKFLKSEGDYYYRLRFNTLSFVIHVKKTDDDTFYSGSKVDRSLIKERRISGYQKCHGPQSLAEFEDDFISMQHLLLGRESVPLDRKIHQDNKLSLNEVNWIRQRYNRYVDNLFPELKS